MKILKFGGKSLSFDGSFSQVLEIIDSKVQAREEFAVVVSAISDTTDVLEHLLIQASKGLAYQEFFEAFKNKPQHQGLDLSSSFDLLEKIFEGVFLLQDYSLKVKDEVLAQGELISAQVLTHHLLKRGIQAHFVDARKLVVTNANFGNAQPIEQVSKQRVATFFNGNVPKGIAVITGFIGSNERLETTTLGRNGSNYSAALFANYLEAEEVQNYTHVDGVFTANPEWVKDAKKIAFLNFNEANELANFGASILHAKTIVPLLEKQIPLRILNTQNPSGTGTLISAAPTPEGIKSLSVQSNVALINFEGRGLLGKVGIDARIFKTLSNHNINVGVISQGSSERGIGFVVPSDRASEAVVALEQEFEIDFYNKDVNKISINEEVAVISIVGQELQTFHKPYNALIRNAIVPILFNNTVTGKNVSLVVEKSLTKKALNVIHGEIFGVHKKINIAVFGVGNVGKQLVEQILAARENLQRRKEVNLNIFAVANSKKLLLASDGIGSAWEFNLALSTTENSLELVYNYAKEHHLENLIAVDNTANASLVASYIDLIGRGFDLVSSNKIANTQTYSFYKQLRHQLVKNHKDYLYETNVGAGLPLIDTIKLLHLSGDNITKIRGVFSGTLSYLFNTFSSTDLTFSQVLKQAIASGFTEPDAREDLSGADVGRKLLILARELDLENEWEELAIENLISKDLQDLTVDAFYEQLSVLDPIYEQIKRDQEPGHVLRYIGELSGDLQQRKGDLKTQLVSVPVNSALGQLKGSDSIFEIFTTSYGDHPIIIQGAGAGAAVTARGVFGDILRLISKK